LEKERLSLLWAYNGSLTACLSRATWLDTAHRLCDLGWDVTFLAVDAPVDELDSRIRLVKLAWPKAYLVGHLSYHLSMLKWVVRHGSEFDVVLFNQDPTPFLLTASVIMRLMGKKRPGFVMDTQTVPMTLAGWRAKLHAAYFGFAHALANRFADGQTANTQRMADAIKVPAMKFLGAWSSGVEAERFTKALNERQWPGPNDPLRLTYVGTLEEQRNVMGLCKAVAKVRSEGLNVELDVVGGGPQWEDLDNFARGEQGEGITVRRAVPREQVADVLMGAHIGVLPFPDGPQFRVSSPVKLFEYMAAGMPILATRIVCHTDVVGTGEGYVFWAEKDDPESIAKAIRTAYENKDKLSAMGKRANQETPQWTWGAAAARLDRALRRLVTGREGFRGQRKIAAEPQS
jgi:glycosyltransferase involved in cell wall biosynthesis